jgi:Subtilase family/Secretion system C-terminal sorting domain
MQTNYIKRMLVMAAIGWATTALAQQPSNGILFHAGKAYNPASKLSGLLQVLQQKAVANTANKTGSLPLTDLNTFSSKIQQSAKGLIPFLIKDNRIGVQLIVGGTDAQSLAVLRAAGLQITSQSDFTVSGFIEPAWLGVLDGLPNVKSINPIMGVGNNIGATTTQTAKAVRTDVAKFLFPAINGAGVKVGVISDSYNLTGQGAQNSVNSGDLPGAGNPNGFTTPVQVVSDNGLVSRTDEGRGMMEIVHDIAPGAGLAFADPGDYSQQGFANAINALRNAGCQIITDDVFNFGEPWFQDGLANRAIDNFTAAGGTYVVSAGNHARQSYETPFKNANQAGPAGGRTHNFAATGVDNKQRVTLGPNSGFVIFLQWSDRYGSVNGALGATADLAINFFEGTTGTYLGSTENSNIGGDPVDATIVGSGDETLVLDIQIEVRSGTTPSRIKYAYLPFGSVTFNEYQPRSGTVFGHPNAASAITVGAADYRFTPPFGTPNPLLEFFSSAGGITVAFNTNGQLINAVRPKPEIVSADNGNTSFFPLVQFQGNTDIENDGFPNFQGTSASAPNAAAVAALIKQARPTITPAGIKQSLILSCLDMDDPATPGPDPGFDFGTGSGLIRADRALVLAGAVPFGLAKTALQPGRPITDALSLTLSPNPAKDLLQVAMAATTKQAIPYSIIDAQGKPVQKGFLNGPVTAVKINSLAPGSYVIQAQGSNNLTAKAVFIKD